MNLYDCTSEGKITGGSAEHGGAIYCSGNTYLYAGTIQQNYAPIGGGVYHTGSELRFGGTPKIIDNKTQNDSKILSNVYIPNNKYATVSTGMFTSLAEGADIGITKGGTFGRIVKTSTDVRNHFKSDEEKNVLPDGDYLWVMQTDNVLAGTLIEAKNAVDSIMLETDTNSDLVTAIEALDKAYKIALDIKGEMRASFIAELKIKLDCDNEYITFKYVSGSLPQDEATDTIEEINKELV